VYLILISSPSLPCTIVNKTKENITKMDSITAMIFSPKAWPIRLLLLDGISVLPVASTLVASPPMTSVSEVRHQLRQV
jgi:hypothetical protein